MSLDAILPGGRLTVPVGGLTRDELTARLDADGVQRNPHADALLAEAIFDAPAVPERIVVVERSVADLGFPGGATLPQIFAAAEGLGLHLCPIETGPYLRLALTEQVQSPDSVMQAGRAPTGALTVASTPLSDDPDVPKGFYLRVVDGQRWLRGYRCDDLHVFAADDRFAFQESRRG